MKLIKELSEIIEDEIGDVQKYAKMAIEVKDEHPALADVLYNISRQEADHMNKLHEQVAKLIIEYRDKNGTPPADMLAVYDYLHKKQIEEYAGAKRYQDIYTGGK